MNTSNQPPSADYETRLDMCRGWHCYDTCIPLVWKGAYNPMDTWERDRSKEFQYYLAAYVRKNAPAHPSRSMFTNTAPGPNKKVQAQFRSTSVRLSLRRRERVRVKCCSDKRPANKRGKRGLDALSSRCNPCLPLFLYVTTHQTSAPCSSFPLHSRIPAR